MEIQRMPLGDLSPDPSNARRHPERNLDAIIASLRKFGQQKPIVVDGRGIVVAGNGTFEAAKRLGWSEIAVVRTDLAGIEATAFAIADNRTAELASWDYPTLARLCEVLVGEGDGQGAIGFTDEELAGIMGASYAPPECDEAEGAGFQAEPIKVTVEQRGAFAAARKRVDPDEQMTEGEALRTICLKFTGELS